MRALFLGNSYLHRGAVPLKIAHIAETMGRALRVYGIAPEGASMRDHVESDEVEHTLEFGGWDVLVLQEHSLRLTRTLGHPHEAAGDVAALAELLESSSPSSRILLLQTWARHPDHLHSLPDPLHRFYPARMASPQAMLDELREGAALVQGLLHRSGSVHIPCDVVRIGDAWQRYMGDAPDHVRLHDDDGSHAGLHGQWLTALGLTEALFGTLEGASSLDGCDDSILDFAR